MLGGLSGFLGAASSPDLFQLVSTVGPVLFSVGVAFATLRANQKHTDQQIEAVREELKKISSQYEEAVAQNHELRLALARNQARIEAQEKLSNEAIQSLKDFRSDLTATREAVIEMRGILAASSPKPRTRGGSRSC
jgi:septal ring factor EnvC (AmiA/AmiB activator)